MNRKIFTFILTITIALVLIIQPAMATVYIDHDFNEGISTDSITTNRVSDYYIFSGESYPWMSTKLATAGNTSSYHKYVVGDASGNASGFLMGQGKFNNPVDLTMEMRDAEGVAQSVVGDELYVDIRIKRTGTNEAGANLLYADENNKIITYLRFPSSNIDANPTLVAGSSVSALCDGAYTYNTWWYFRLVLNFTDKTFTAFHGTSLATLVKFNATYDSYSFSNATASNFNKVIIGMASPPLSWNSSAKGAFSIDDFRVYDLDSPTPTASDIALTGKPNVGEALTATYGTYSEPNGVLEGGSYGYWESSDNFAFTNPTKLTANIPMTAGDSNAYTLTANESGKYVRFVAVPVTVDGDEGIHGTILPQKVDSIIAELDVIGATSGDGKTFVFNSGQKAYGGRVIVSNTTGEAKTLSMVTAWYQNDILESVYITPVSISAGSAEETGIKTATITLATGSQKSFADEASMSGYKLRVFLLDSIVTIRPICTNRYVSESK